MPKKRMLLFLLLISGFFSLSLKKAGRVANISSSPFSFDQYAFIIHEKREEEKPISILEISKLDLQQNIYEKNSKENDVDKNITLLTDICLLKEDCTLVLAAHSGSSAIAYFKNLDKLTIGDEAMLHYQDKTYLFELFSIEKVSKNGQLILKKEKGKYLLLTTCDKQDETKQDVYYFYLKDKKTLNF